MHWIKERKKTMPNNLDQKYNLYLGIDGLDLIKLKFKELSVFIEEKHASRENDCRRQLIGNPDCQYQQALEDVESKLIELFGDLYDV